MHLILLKMTSEPLRWLVRPLRSLAVLCPLEVSVYRGAWQARCPQAMVQEEEEAPSHFVDNPLRFLPIPWALLSVCPPRALVTLPQAT